jgi:23S rRNA (pseudouridine1915-N3)-methyltransferase
MIMCRFYKTGARMPKIKIIVVGNTKSSFIKEGEQVYLERLRHYAGTEWVEVKPQKVRKGRSGAEILAAEGQSIDKKLISGDHIIALDIRGKEYDSEGLAKWIERLSLSGKNLCFITGGPLGLSKKILHAADEILSLSKLTLTHEMSRLLLLEQLYRAHSIIRGEKYHK